jgi:hypothetical protein
MGLRDKPRFYDREMNTLRLCENELNYISRANNLTKSEVIKILRESGRLDRRTILSIRYSGGNLYGEKTKTI